jgi:hypothetical protein
LSFKERRGCGDRDRSERDNVPMPFEDLLTAYEFEPDDAKLHVALRQARAQMPTEFDAVWRERFGPPPKWLTLDDAVYERCLAWLNAPTWAESKALLEAHPELLDPAAFEEIALSYPGHPAIADHRELLAECQQLGIDAAYEPLLLGELVRAWRAIDDLDESRRFLLDHREQLATPRAASAAMANRDRLGHAILGLAHENEIDLAYAILADPSLGPQALTDARRAGRAMKLIALAALVGVRDPGLGYLHLAIGMAIGGEVDAAADLLERLPDRHPNAQDMITDAMTHRPEHAAGLARLLDALRGAA